MYGREEDKSFWTRGDSRADIVFKANTAIRRAVFMIAAGPVPVDVTIRLGGRRHDVHLEANGTQQIAVAMPDGVMFEKEVEGGRLWNVVVTTKGGFTPIFYDANASDSRYLGARIKPILESRLQ